MYSAVSASDKEQTTYVEKIKIVQCIRLHPHIQLLCMFARVRCIEIATESGIIGKPFGMAGKFDSYHVWFLVIKHKTYSDSIWCCSSTV